MIEVVRGVDRRPGVVVLSRFAAACGVEGCVPMYAVIESGGKQYRVVEGDVIDVELTSITDGEPRTVNFDRVLMVSGDTGVKVGSPVVSGASVSAVLVREVRAPKIRIFKKKRRKGYKKSAGHRQDLLRVRIEAINV